MLNKCLPNDWRMNAMPSIILDCLNTLIVSFNNKNSMREASFHCSLHTTQINTYLALFGKGDKEWCSRLLLTTHWVSLMFWRCYAWPPVLCCLFNEVRQFLVDIFCFSFSQLRLGQSLRSLVGAGLPLPFVSLVPWFCLYFKYVVYHKEIHLTSSFQALIYRNKK